MNSCALPFVGQGGEQRPLFEGPRVGVPVVEVGEGIFEIDATDVHSEKLVGAAVANGEIDGCVGPTRHGRLAADEYGKTFSFKSFCGPLGRLCRCRSWWQQQIERRLFRRSLDRKAEMNGGCSAGEPELIAETQQVRRRRRQSVNRQRDNRNSAWLPEGDGTGNRGVDEGVALLRIEGDFRRPTGRIQSKYR
ncbi:hypothetical protein OUZ56_032345 [Daphnia magna]|uniref:Uncharacterized protein n=1 Tax=Daphnia magna TaxID=35525 RepID=A0ABR0B8M8_9CRUS|nr:hypothetical protein OUZ56_032345 [Daphnia magna]